MIKLMMYVMVLLLERFSSPFRIREKWFFCVMKRQQGWDKVLPQGHEVPPVSESSSDLVKLSTRPLTGGRKTL